MLGFRDCASQKEGWWRRDIADRGSKSRKNGAPSALLLMETSTASRLLTIRLFVKIYGPGLPNKLWQCRVSGHKLSALLSALSNLVPFTQPVSIVLLSNPFFLIPIMCLLILFHRCIQDPFLALHSCFNSPKSSVDLVSHHLLPQILPCSLSPHPSFTASSIPTSLCSHLVLSPFSLSCYSFCTETKRLLAR